MKLEDIGFYTLSDERAKKTSETSPMQRCELILTDRCNFNCKYCRGVRDDCKGTMEYVDAQFILGQWMRGGLKNVRFSGGEPTLHPSLPDLMELIRSFGYATALHTNGNFPDMLRLLLRRNLVDYVAMDVKAPPKAYDRVTGCDNTGVMVARSITEIISSGVEYEFRTTYHPILLSADELMDTMRAVHTVGARRYYLQRFQPRGVEDDELLKTGDTVDVPEAVVREAEKLFADFGVR